MTKSKSTSLPPLLKRIDELLISHHPFLESGDEVYFINEYTNRKGFSFSPENQLIFNYKIKPEHKGTPRWIHKETAIKDVAALFRSTILQTFGLQERMKSALLIPIPPHKAKNDPGYDDRNLKMLNLFMPNGNIHELVHQKESREPLHESNDRDVEKLKQSYLLNSLDTAFKFNEIWLFDDVLRHGTHFRAIHSIAKASFPNVKIVGFFIARSVQYFADPAKLFASSPITF